MADEHVLVPSMPPSASECYHLPTESGDSQPYCTPSTTYERVPRRRALARGMRLCRRCAQKTGTGRNTVPETTCPFCTATVVKTRLPHHLQECSNAP